jgi:outer membrane protein OmpA-like peptidoglycan-associated protein
MLKTLAIGLLIALGSTAAQAQQSTIHYRANDRIDPEEVARVLATPSQQPLSRSIRLLGDGAGSAGPAIAATNAAAAPSAFSVPVQFAFDSATILPAARAQLDAIASGIKMLPATQGVTLEGHTDATGAETYNLSLSQRRAAAVKAYLVEVHGIEAQRLHDRGYGKQRPIEGLNPFAAENRRVQFRGG